MIDYKKDLRYKIYRRLWLLSSHLRDYFGKKTVRRFHKITEPTEMKRNGKFIQTEEGEIFVPNLKFNKYFDRNYRREE